MKKSNFFLLFLLSVLVVFSCKKAIDHNTNPAIQDVTPYDLEIGTLPDPQIPADNELTNGKVQLGRMLFYEKMLSGDNSMSCASCHNQRHAFTDTARLSTGIDGLLGHRQAMAIFNLAWNDNDFFWDGRANLLREQSLMPIQDVLEMHETLPNVIAKLQAKERYRGAFIRAFGDEEITQERISLALEAFMHSIVSNNSKYDRFLVGQAQLTESEERGRQLFFTEYNPFFPDLSGADCAHCHSGSNFENDMYMNNGLDSDANMADIGREAVTGNPADRGHFKVTSLRNIAVTFPYMHDGRFRTLEEVVEHYNSGIVLSATVDPTIANTHAAGLMLSEQDKKDLVAFLKTLTDYTLLNDPRYSSPFKD